MAIVNLYLEGRLACVSLQLERRQWRSGDLLRFLLAPVENARELVDHGAALRARAWSADRAEISH